MEELVKKTRGEPGRSKSLDEVLKEEQESLIEESKQIKLEEITSKRKVNIAENEAKVDRIRNIRSGSGSVTVGEAPIKALLQGFIESGVEPEKAASFIKALDDEAIARLIMLGGGNTSNLMPLVMMAKKESITVKDLTEYTSSYIDTLMKLKGGDEKPSSLKEIVETLLAIQGMQGDNSEITAELRELKSLYLQNIQAQHQSELKHSNDIAQMRVDAVQKELERVNTSLATMQNRNFSVQFKEYKDTLESLGLKVTQPGAEDRGVDFEKLTETIISAPAVEGLLNNIGESLKIRAQQQRQVMAPARQTTRIVERLCDICMQKGVRTMLKIPPELFEGKATLTCDVCGSTYGKQQ